MSTLAQFEIDTEEQRQHRCNDARLTKSTNARSEQLLMMSTESLTNREWLPGELLSRSNVKARLVFRYEILDLQLFLSVLKR